MNEEKAVYGDGTLLCGDVAEACLNGCTEGQAYQAKHCHVKIAIKQASEAPSQPLQKVW